VNQATITEPSQEPKSWGDQLHRTKEIAPSDSPVKVATTFNKINSSSNRSAKPEVTIQDVEDALLQIEIAAAKEPPLHPVSCCSPTHAAGGESDSLLLSPPSTNVEPSCSVEIDTNVEPSCPLEIDASSPVLTCHQLEDTELAKATLEGATRLRLRRCRFHPGCVYTRSLCCGSAHPRRGFGAAARAEPCMDIGG